MKSLTQICAITALVLATSAASAINLGNLFGNTKFFVIPKVGNCQPACKAFAVDSATAAAALNIGTGKDTNLTTYTFFGKLDGWQPGDTVKVNDTTYKLLNVRTFNLSNDKAVWFVTVTASGTQTYGSSPPSTGK